MSLQRRILALFLALLLAVLGVTLATVSRATYRHTLERAREELGYARRIVVDKLRARERALGEAAATLTKDDALRQAIFAGGDPESVLVALENHRLRTSADLSMLVELDGRVLTDTARPERRGRAFPHPELLAAGGAPARSPRLVLLDGVAYQLAVAPYYVPVSAPEPALWLLLGAAVGDPLAEELRELIGVDVAILATPGGGEPLASVGASFDVAGRIPGTMLAEAAAEEVALRELAGAELLTAGAPLGSSAGASARALLVRPVSDALLDYRELVGRFLVLAAASALLATGGAFLIARGVTRPIRILAQAAQRAAAGDYAAELPKASGGEIRRLAVEFASMRTAVSEREAAIEHLAYHDDLTGLPNRNRFRDEIVAGLGAAAARRGRAAVAVMDIDRFREINDTLGHHVGDRLLLEVARRLRQAASAGGLRVARLGGDEFGVFGEVEGVAEARERLAELRAHLARGTEVDELRMDLEASVGIALYPDHGGDPATLLRQAEVAMYVAKERRLGVAFYDASQDRHSIERLSLVGDLRRALESEGGLELAFQPKLDLRTGRCDEVEVLLRWEHPRRGRVGPAEFVPIAEQTGQIRRLTAWVLDRTAAQLALWRADGLELVAAVNLSALDLDAGLARRLGELLSRAGVPPRQLALEITESSVMADAEAAGRALTEVAEMGVRVAIDDFGTGYSSLAQLKRLPVRELKVDRSFVADLVRSPDVRQIVRSTIELGHNLGLEVVAEGVETPEALASLREMSCDKVQGHHVSEPLAAAELAAWLASAAERRGGTVRA